VNEYNVTTSKHMNIFPSYIQSQKLVTLAPTRSRWPTKVDLLPVDLKWMYLVSFHLH